jgi:hypothetical protein
MTMLADLGILYPSMRFGQLIEMVAVLSGEEDPLSPGDVEDDQLLDAAADQIHARRQQLQAEDGSEQIWPMSEARASLISVLERLREQRPDVRFGHLVEHLAKSRGSCLYDVEDEQLTAAARALTTDQPA